jgi:exosortase A
VITTVPRPEFTPLLLIAGIAALVVLVYLESFVSMARLWTYSAYSHGVIVAPTSAYLLWRIRAQLTTVELRPWPWGLVLILPLVLLWFISRAIAVQALEHLTVVLLIPATVATCLGSKLARRALFPLLFLVAAVPVGDSLIPLLMRFTADLSSFLLKIVGVPVFRDGQFLSLPGGEFEIADVCAGLRYLIAGTMIALLFAYLKYQNVRRRTVFVLIAAGALVIANGVRAFIVMYVASASNMRVLVGADHIYFGWLLFGAVMGALLWVGSQRPDESWAESLEVSADGAAAVARGLPVVLVLGLVMLAMTAQPLQRDMSTIWLLLPGGGFLLWSISRFFAPLSGARGPGGKSGTSSYRNARAAAVVYGAVALLIGGPLLFARFSAARTTEHAEPATLPAVAQCAGPGAWGSDWQPEWRAPDYRLAGTYVCDGQRVDLFAAGYRANAQGRELVGDDNKPVASDWRRFMSTGHAEFVASSGRATTVNEVRVDGADVRSLIWYWYSIGDSSATSPSVVKILQAWELLKEHRSDSEVYWLSTPLDGSVEQSRERLSTVARELPQALHEHAPAARSP